MRIEKRLAFEAAEYRARLESVRGFMAEADLDALVLCLPENICYLSGFETPGYYYPQALIVTPDQDPVLAIRGLERGNFEAHSWLAADRCIGFLDHEAPEEAIARAMAEAGADRGRIGFELARFFLPVALHDALEAVLPGASFVDASGLVERARRIKSPAEIAYLRRGSDAACAAVAVARAECRPGVSTENDIAAAVSGSMTRAGSEYAGLPVFVCSGHRTLIPHATPTEKAVQAGEAVFLEHAGVFRRYAAPIFRTLFCGPPPARVRELAGFTAEMVDRVIEAIGPGATSAAVNEAAAAVVARAGGTVHKRAGYSVGLNFPPDWGEGYMLDLKSGDGTVLEPGMVFHIPQTLRLPGEVPMALSETVLVTGTGCEVLTDGRHELIEV
ncbi:MAG: aminopeptidase P family protein [Rhodospirillaceae bacterium]|jgi:Xaa-Pro dipeptidase|nr:aminopeptidase P family protein [Rhodospirillaceae bacterium]